MRILLLSEFYPPVLGGLELHVQTLATALHGRGHDVHVGTLTPGSDPSTDPFPVHRLSSTAARASFLHERAERPFHPPVPDPEVTLGLRRLIGELRPDVIHAHNWIAASVPRRNRPPLVVTAHDYGSICARRDLLAFDQRICSGPTPARCLRCSAAHFGPVRGAVLPVVTALGRMVVRADAYVAVSAAVAERLERFLPSEPVVVPNFVPDDIDAVRSPVAGLPDRPFVMHAGAAGRHKGTDVLLEAWGDGSMPAPLVLAATNPDGVRVPRGVTALRLSRSEVITAWREAAVAVVPSVWADPCPTVALEAMCAGTPVVASEVGGLVELVDDTRRGLLVPPGDPAALRHAILRLLGDEPLRKEMGDAARQQGQRYLVSSVVPKLEDVYQSVIERRSPAANRFDR